MVGLCLCLSKSTLCSCSQYSITELFIKMNFINHKPQNECNSESTLDIIQSVETTKWTKLHRIITISKFWLTGLKLNYQKFSEFNFVFNFDWILFALELLSTRCNQLFTIFDQLIWIKVVIKLIADIYDSINK